MLRGVLGEDLWGVVSAAIVDNDPERGRERLRENGVERATHVDRFVAAGGDDDVSRGGWLGRGNQVLRLSCVLGVGFERFIQRTPRASVGGRRRDNNAQGVCPRLRVGFVMVSRIH